MRRVAREGRLALAPPVLALGVFACLAGAVVADETVIVTACPGARSRSSPLCLPRGRRSRSCDRDAPAQSSQRRRVTHT
jgi:hypothetical protein